MYENDNALGILDIGQVFGMDGEIIPGRCLVISKRHVRHYHDLEDEEAGQLFIAAKALANKIKRAFNPEFVTIFIRGQRVPHVHIILQPSTEGDPVDSIFRQVRQYFKVAPDDLLDEIAQKISQGGKG